MQLKQVFAQLSGAKLSSSKVSGSRFWLISIGAGLVGIHLTLVDHSGQAEMLSSSLLYWIAVSSLIWKKRDQLRLNSSFFGTLLGLLLVAIVLIKSQSISNIDSFLRVSPLISAIGLAAIASGIRGIKQYWQEFAVLSFMIPHSGVLSQAFDSSKLTAEFATSLLWCLGFDASRQGVYVLLPTGSVEVNPGCSGYGSILQLLSLAVIFLFMFPTSRFQKLLMPIAAVCLGFSINAIRVALMAILSASGDKAAFLYWHNNEGSLAFSFISVLLFGLFCYFMLQQEQSDDDLEPEQPTES
jgi:cyanoexosortase A